LKPTVINFTELRTSCGEHIYYRITCTNKNEERENPGSNKIESKDGVLPGRFNDCQKIIQMVLRSVIWFFLTALLFSCQPAGQSEAGKMSEKEQSNNIQAKTVPHTKTIVFFGNSLTAAYKLNPSKGFVSLLQQRLDSLGLRYKAINAGLSGETTAGGRERLDWVIRQPLDIFVLELGGNDALRGIAPTASYENLDAIITAVKTKYPASKIVIAGMMAPPNLGPEYTTAFNGMYPRLAKKHHAALIPFLLENVGGIPELNLPDGIHPNEEGQKIVEENIWRILKSLVETR